MTVMNLVTALNTGLRRALEDDRRVVIMGEDVGRLGGVFRVTDALQKDFGDTRVIDMPLAESGIVGTASVLPCADIGLSAKFNSTGLSTRLSIRSSRRWPRSSTAPEALPLRH